MSNDIGFKEIVFCNIEFVYKKKQYKLDEVVYKYIDGFYYNKRILDRIGVKSKVFVTKLIIIKRMGFENKSKEFTEVKKNEEQRNNITGTYE